ncbi:hypothetical protein DESAMIL20_313 [Desulfurella amilsii]|jgi:hypothetical protein|uniref:Uncharacterized protein n=1 Tax=Desulfurella amilsii TaxID=1562698 RepID=A0A1X4XZF2_9BACT|nr:hypothetical protein [Desulfurella amilsii]OSS42883.1 hypothetical protein DESAMIL20_313 [Desulfurella amilsii]
MDLLKKYFIVLDDDLDIEDIIFYPVFEIRQCAVCKQIFLMPAGSGFEFHITKDHYGTLEFLNRISLNEIKEYKIDNYYPEELKNIILKKIMQ